MASRKGRCNTATVSGKVQRVPTSITPPVLGNCATNRLLGLPEVRVQVMGVFPIVVVGLVPVQVGLGLRFVVFPPSIGALAVIIELVGPSD
jgi:hypothetical protein